MQVNETKRPRDSRRGRRRKIEGTQEKILDAAEALFAKHGLYGVTLKQVAGRARVDTALVHYYFKNKQGLFDSVFGRRAEILNRERMQSLDSYESEAGGAQTAEGITNAFIEPLIERATTGGAGWRNYFALVAQVNNMPAWGGATMTKYFDPVVQRFIDMMRRLLPGTPEEDLYYCFQLLTGSLTLTLSQTGRIDLLSGGLCSSEDLRAVYARLVPYTAGGFRAVCAPKSATPAKSARITRPSKNGSPGRKRSPGSNRDPK